MNILIKLWNYIYICVLQCQYLNLWLYAYNIYK